MQLAPELGQLLLRPVRYHRISRSARCPRRAVAPQQASAATADELDTDKNATTAVEWAETHGVCWD